MTMQYTKEQLAAIPELLEAALRLEDLLDECVYMPMSGGVDKQAIGEDLERFSAVVEKFGSHTDRARERLYGPHVNRLPTISLAA